jgi:hypothetical protein
MPLTRTAALFLAAGSFLAAPALAQQAEASPRPVDLAICLDTSGSMDGLIDAARQKLWEVVNDLATAKPRPALRVALISYGNDGYQSESGWVRVLQPFTTDLDAVSRELFALRTNGGTEYVGRAVAKAAADLDWSSGQGLRLIIVAGNESADQDRDVTYQSACAAAIGKGIMVNAIYCGDDAGPDAAGWRDVARLADGQYVAIDQNRNEVTPTPHDAKLAELSAALNTTYIPIGQAGLAAAENQRAQDANAVGAAPAAAAARAVTKIGTLYVASWDLVDRMYTGEEKDRVKLEAVRDEELPEAMRSMTLAQRAEFVEQQRARRDRIQREIGEESAKRAAFLEAQQRSRTDAAGQTFESALRTAVRDQARKSGFAWEK